MMIGAFFYTAPIFTETFVKIEEKPNFVFISGLTCLVFNVILDYLLIVRLKLGMSGGASATIIACAFGFFALLPNLRFKLPRKKIGYYANDIKNIFYNGSSEMLSVVSSTFAMYLFNLVIMDKIGVLGVSALTIVFYINQLLNISLYGLSQAVVSSTFAMYLFNLVIMDKIGVLGVSALTIVFYINQLLNISLYGLSQALQPLVAYNLGARHLDKIKKVLKVSLITGGSLGVIAYVGSHLWGTFIIKIFSKGNQELIDLAGTALFYVSFAYLISFANIISTSFLTSIEKPLESVIVSMAWS